MQWKVSASARKLSGANVWYRTMSTKIIDVTGSKTDWKYKGYVPPRSVVIPGSHTGFPAGEYGTYCPDHGQRKESTDKKTSRTTPCATTAWLSDMRSCPIIQTAFTGDVIPRQRLRKSCIQPSWMPIDFLVRKGNEGLLGTSPLHPGGIGLEQTRTEDKTPDCNGTFWVRSRKYELVVNLQRFAGSGFISAYSGARYRSGFDKNARHYVHRPSSACDRRWSS